MTNFLGIPSKIPFKIPSLWERILDFSGVLGAPSPKGLGRSPYKICELWGLPHKSEQKKNSKIPCDEIPRSSRGMTQGLGILCGILNEIAPSFFKASQWRIFAMTEFLTEFHDYFTKQRIKNDRQSLRLFAVYGLRCLRCCLSARCYRDENGGVSSQIIQ